MGRICPVNLRIIERLQKLMAILAAYGITTHKSFYGRVRNFKERVTPGEELQDLAARIPEEKVQMLLGLAKALAEGRSIIWH